jgi:hypothetical protein
MEAWRQAQYDEGCDHVRQTGGRGGGGGAITPPTRRSPREKASAAAQTAALPLQTMTVEMAMIGASPGRLVRS